MPDHAWLDLDRQWFPKRSDVDHSTTKYIRASLVPATVMPSDKKEDIDFPLGAIENGRIFAEQVENLYKFKEDNGHDLSVCYEWTEFKRCFEYMADYLVNRRASLQEQDNNHLVKALRDARFELWESWHSDMSLEDFEKHPTIQDIDAALCKHKERS